MLAKLSAADIDACEGNVEYDRTHAYGISAPAALKLQFRADGSIAG